MRIRKFLKCFLVVAQRISASQIQPALDFTRKTLLKIKDILKKCTLFGHTVSGDERSRMKRNRCTQIQSTPLLGWSFGPLML